MNSNLNFPSLMGYFFFSNAFFVLGIISLTFISFLPHTQPMVLPLTPSTKIQVELKYRYSYFNFHACLYPNEFIQRLSEFQLYRPMYPDTCIPFHRLKQGLAFFQVDILAHYETWLITHMPIHVFYKLDQLNKEIGIDYVYTTQVSSRLITELMEQELSMDASLLPSSTTTATTTTTTTNNNNNININEDNKQNVHNPNASQSSHSLNLSSSSSSSSSASLLPTPTTEPTNQQLSTPPPQRHQEKLDIGEPFYLFTELFP